MKQVTKVDVKALALAVLDERDRRGIGVRDIARQAGVNHTTIIRMMQANKVSLDTFFKVIDWLKKNPAKFYRVEKIRY